MKFVEVIIDTKEMAENDSDSNFVCYFIIKIYFLVDKSFTISQQISQTSKLTSNT